MRFRRPDVPVIDDVPEHVYDEGRGLVDAVRIGWSVNRDEAGFLQATRPWRDSRVHCGGYKREPDLIAQIWDFEVKQDEAGLDPDGSPRDF